MYRLLLGDCLEKMEDIEDGSVDMVLADPPHGSTQCWWDTAIPLAPMWEQLWRVTKDNAAVVITATDPFKSALVMSQPDLFRYDLIWEKTQPTGFLNANRMPMRAHESIVVFYRHLPTYNPQKTRNHKPVNSYTKHTGDGEVYGETKLGISGGGSTERYPRSVLLFASDKQKSKLHPTQKPVALMEYLVSTYSNAGDTVLDFAMGSGTAGIACDRLARHFIGIELDEKYYEIAVERIKEEKCKNKIRRMAP